GRLQVSDELFGLVPLAIIDDDHGKPGKAQLGARPCPRRRLGLRRSMERRRHGKQGRLLTWTFGPLTDASRRVRGEEATRGGIIRRFVRTIQCRFTSLPRPAKFAQSARFSRSDMANLPIICNLPE